RNVSARQPRADERLGLLFHRLFQVLDHVRRRQADVYQGGKLALHLLLDATVEFLEFLVRDGYQELVRCLLQGPAAGREETPALSVVAIPGDWRRRALKGSHQIRQAGPAEVDLPQLIRQVAAQAHEDSEHSMQDQALITPLAVGTDQLG